MNKIKIDNARVWRSGNSFVITLPKDKVTENLRVSGELSFKEDKITISS